MNEPRSMEELGDFVLAKGVSSATLAAAFEQVCRERRLHRTADDPPPSLGWFGELIPPEAKANTFVLDEGFIRDVWQAITKPQ